MAIMTIQEIKKKCREISMEYWGLEFNIVVEISGRMSKTLGQMVSYKGNKYPPKLMFSRRLLTYYKNETIDSVIRHEVCHWALYTLKQPFKDTDSYFKSELKRVNGSFTGTVNPAGVVHELICSNCSGSYLVRTEREKNNCLNTSKVISSCCKVKFLYAGQVLLEDKFILN